MLLSEILKQKKVKKDALKKKITTKTSSTKFFGIIMISDENILENLIEGLSKLPCYFYIVTEKKLKKYHNISYVKEINDRDLIGFDFLVSDNCDAQLLEHLEKLIVPILNDKTCLKNILLEFNPLKSEGNAFFFGKTDPWNIFYSLVRYLENSKFPYDNKNLLTNIYKTK